MSIYKNLQRFAALLLTFAVMSVNAAVVNPKLDIQNIGSDAGVSSTASLFEIDATAFTILTDGGPVDITDTMFFLSSDTSGVGSIEIGSLLSATFSNLSVFDLGSGIGSFAADLSYTSGSLMGSLTGGTIEGSFFGATGTIGLGQAFSANNIVAKVGPVVVPIPAAVWLFGSGLLAMVGAIKRKVV